MSEVNKQLLDAVKEFFSAEQSEGREKTGHVYKPATREHQQREWMARIKLHEAIAAAEQARQAEPVARATGNCHGYVNGGLFCEVEVTGMAIPAGTPLFAAHPVARDVLMALAAEIREAVIYEVTKDNIVSVTGAVIKRAKRLDIDSIVDRYAAHPPAVAVAVPDMAITNLAVEHFQMDYDRLPSSVFTFARAVLAAAQQAVVTGWIDPNDKTQRQFLPHIGEPVLFCHGGVTYYGVHTGGSFKTGQGVTTRNFNTWECQWMYPPAAAQKGGA